MAWYDSIVSAYDKAKESVVSGYDALVSDAGDRVGEKVQGAVEQRTSDRSAQPTARRPASPSVDQVLVSNSGGGFDWTKAGVIVGAVGLVLTLMKMKK